MPNDDLAITLDVEGDRELMRAFERFPKEVVAGLLGTAQRSVKYLEGVIKPEVPIDTGHGVNSIVSGAKPVVGGVQGWVGGSAAHLMFVEHGARPHYTAVENVEGWAARHGVSPWVVVQAIAKKGTKAVHMFLDAYKAHGPTVVSWFNQEIARLVKQFGR